MKAAARGVTSNGSPPPHATPTQTQPAPDSVIRDGDQIQSPDTNICVLHYLDESLTPKFQTLTWVFLATCHVKTKSNIMQQQITGPQSK